MKTIATFSVIALSCSVALAAPHGYQQQIGSSELDPHIWDGPELQRRSAASHGFEDSRTAIYEQADVDGDGAFHFVGRIVPSGPTRISLYEVQRGSPEGTANQAYHDRFPAGTGSDAIAAGREARDGEV